MSEKKEVGFYLCRHCGNLVEFIKQSAMPIFCCGEAMIKLVPNTTDASVEKHVPVIKVAGNIITVDVGSVAHPMTSDHYIMWIAIQTELGYQQKDLLPNEKPSASFSITSNDKLIRAYAYCNLHGLWKAEV